MQRSRRKVSLRRMCALAGVVGGLFLWGVLPLASHGSSYGPQKRSIFFGDMTDWPQFFQGWWPLDLLTTVFFFGLTTYLFMSTSDSSEESSFVRRSLRLFWVLGTMFGTMGPIMYGWYAGLEFFVFGCILTATLMAGLAGLFGLLIGFGLLVRAGWRRIQHRRFMRPVAALGRFLKASDVPENPPARDNTKA